VGRKLLTLLSFEEFCECEKDGIYLDDLPLDLNIQDSYRLFNVLPMNMKLGIVKWGYSDTCVREDVFEWVVQKIYGFDNCPHWYKDFDANYANAKFAELTEIQWSELESGR